MTQPRRVGILGGMGPEATVLLMQKIIAATPARDDADHVPLIVDQNPQVPSRIKRLIEGTGEDPGPVLAEMAKRLQTAGASALAMPCNTAHHFVPEIRAAVSIPFIDMIALSMDHALGLVGKGGTLGILASPAVRRVGLFDAPAKSRGIFLLYAEDETETLAAIREIKAHGATPAAKAGLQMASDDLLSRGASVQMIACTEFSLIPKAIPPKVKVFDTLDQLVTSIIAFSLNSGEGQEKPVSKAG